MSNAFAGRVIANIQKWNNGSGAFLVKVTSLNGKAIKPTVVDIKEQTSEIERLQALGLASGATVSFQMKGVLQWAPPTLDAEGNEIPRTGDRRLKGREYQGVMQADTPIHRPLGYVPGSMTVVLGAAVMELELETDPQQVNFNKNLDAVTAHLSTPAPSAEVVN